MPKYLVIVEGESLNVPGFAAYGTGAILQVQAEDERDAIKRTREQLDPRRVPIGAETRIVVAPYPPIEGV